MQNVSARWFSAAFKLLTCLYPPTGHSLAVFVHKLLSIEIFGKRRPAFPFIGTIKGAASVLNNNFTRKAPRTELFTAGQVNESNALCAAAATTAAIAACIFIINGGGKSRISPKV